MEWGRRVSRLAAFNVLPFQPGTTLVGIVLAGTPDGFLSCQFSGSHEGKVCTCLDKGWTQAQRFDLRVADSLLLLRTENRPHQDGFLANSPLHDSEPNASENLFQFQRDRASPNLKRAIVAPCEHQGCASVMASFGQGTKEEAPVSEYSVFPARFLHSSSVHRSESGRRRQPLTIKGSIEVIPLHTLLMGPP